MSTEVLANNRVTTLSDGTEYFFTLARWHNALMRVTRVVGGQRVETEEWRKHLSHGGRGWFEKAQYGVIYRSPGGYGGRCADATRESHDHHGPQRDGHQVAVVLAPSTRLFAIDVDNPDRFALSNTADLVTRERHAVCTRGGGWHAYVYVPEGLAHRWPRQGPRGGWDVKSMGFVPLPGCVHYSGETYDPAPGEIIIATDELLDAIEADRDDHLGALARGEGGPGDAGEGNEPELLRFTGKLVADGLRDREEAWQRWLAHAQTLPLSVPDWGWTEDNRDVFDRHWAYCVAQNAVNHPPFEVTLPTWAVAAVPEPPAAGASDVAIAVTGFASLTVASQAVEAQGVEPSANEGEGDDGESPGSRGHRPRTLDEIAFSHLDDGPYRDDQVGMAELVLDVHGSRVGWDPEVGRFVVFNVDEGVWRWDGGKHELVWSLVDGVARRCHALMTRELRESPDLLAILSGDGTAQNRARVERIRAAYHPFRNTAGITAVVNAVLPLATRRSQRDFNARPTLLSFRNGTYDVVTGELREHRQADLLSQRVERELDLSLAERPLADVAPHFWGLLRRMCAAPGEVSEAVHAERVAAVTRWLGYQLHGSNPEKKMGVFEGASDIGKNQLLEVVGELLGPGLAWLAGRPTLLVKTKGDRHDAEEYQLAGTRMTLVNEMTASQILDEAQVLRLVNPEGSVVSLRRMRQDRIDVAVTWKFTNSTNELPRANLTPQVVNRLALFRLSGVPVPKTEQYDVKRAALAEGDAVLAHLVAWWREWWLARHEAGAASGLILTAEMTRALTSYQDENKDLFAQFVDDLLEVTGQEAHTVKPKTAWDSFNAWFTDQHPNEDRRYGLGRNAFYKRLEELPGVTRNSRVDAAGKVRLEDFRGLRLLPGAAGLLRELAEGWASGGKSS